MVAVRVPQRILLSQQLTVQAGAVLLTAAHVLLPHIVTDSTVESQLGGTSHLPTGSPVTAVRTPQCILLSQQLTVQACAEPLTAGHALVPHIETEDTAGSQLGCAWHALTPSSVAVRLPHSPCAVQQLTVQACAELLTAAHVLVPHIDTEDTAGSQVSLAIMPPSAAPALPPTPLPALPATPLPASPLAPLFALAPPAPAPPVVPLVPWAVPESWPPLPPEPLVIAPASSSLLFVDPSGCVTLLFEHAPASIAASHATGSDNCLVISILRAREMYGGNAVCRTSHGVSASWRCCG
jgi:hypothetical protein